MNKIKPVIVVCGPSQSGKTRYAHEIRAHFDQDDIIDNWNGEDLLVAGDIAFTNLPIEQFLPDASDRYQVMSIRDALVAINVYEGQDAVDLVFGKEPKTEAVSSIKKKPSDWWESRSPLAQALWNAACCEASADQMALAYHALLTDEARCQAVVDEEGLSPDPDFIKNFKVAAQNFDAIASAYASYSIDADDPGSVVPKVAKSREQILTDVLEGFRKTLSECAADAMKTAYSDYLPYIESDTDANIAYRVQGALANVLARKFKVDDDKKFMSVEDGYGQAHFVSFADYSKVVEPIVEAFAEKLKDSRIKQLESEVKRLRDIASNGF